MLTHLQLNDANWDVLVVGDGSGQGWELGAGWASVLIDKHTYARKLLFGALNVGTVTLGELFPYIHALTWYTGKDGPGQQRRREIANALGRAVQIHIVTDSAIIAAAGNHPESRHAYAELWAVFDAFTRSGFEQTFHHVPREVVDLNILVDEVSRTARVALEASYETAVAALVRKYPGLPTDVTIYDFSG